MPTRCPGFSQPAGERRGQSHRRRRFDQQLEIFEHDAHRGDDLRFRHGHDVVDVRTQQLEVAHTDGAAQSIGNGVAAWLPNIAGRISASDRRRRPARVRRQCTRMPCTRPLAANAVPPMSPPPSHGRADDFEIGHFGQQLQRRGALPRDDSFVIEGMHEFAWFARQHFAQLLLARREPGSQNSTRAPAASMFATFTRGIARYHHNRLHAARPCRQRERRAVVARGMRGHQRRPRRDRVAAAVFIAPRYLNAPPACRFSHLKNTCAPTRAHRRRR